MEGHINVRESKLAVFGQQIQIDVKQCQILEIKTAASTINCQKQRNDAMLFIPGKTIEHINQTIDLIFNVDGRSSPPIAEKNTRIC